MTLKLTPHGQTKDICEWVVSQYKNNPIYKDNKTIQEWVCQSEFILKDELCGITVAESSQVK